MKKTLIINLLLITGIMAINTVHAKAPEFTIQQKDISHLPVWHRIKHTIQNRFEHVFNSKKKLQDIIRQGNTVVKFYRPGCKYCTYIDPILKSVAESTSDVTFISVNLDAQTRDYKKQYGFEYVPTVLYFKNGKEIMRHDSKEGTITVADIKNNIAHAFTTKQAQPMAQSSSLLAKDEKACIQMLISLAEAHITELSAQLNAFFDTKGNKDPYKMHVEKFHQILMRIDEAIATPLKKAVESSKNPEYKKALELMQSIVEDLHKNLGEAHAVFKANEGKDALTAAAKLGDLKKDADVRRPIMEQKLKALHAQLRSLDAGLADQIDKLHKSLPKIFENELSNLVLLNRLKERLKMTK